MSKKLKSEIPALPDFLTTKFYKTGQTRGADDDVIYQNRVIRNSTVLIDYDFVEICKLQNAEKYENGFIVLIKPEQYFGQKNFAAELKKEKLVLGKNALLFYETRKDWEEFNPKKLGFKAAKNRVGDLGGKFVARVPATTSKDGEKINLGYNSKSSKGAGIRVYEYASSQTIADTRDQLEKIFWHCHDSVEAMKKLGMSQKEINDRKKFNEEICKAKKLDDIDALIAARILNSKKISVCPLCLEEISALGFFNKVLQAEGRKVNDLTITELNLFHIQELRVGSHNHRPYNLGWGHHHCNVVTKDAGILDTIAWMKKVISNQG